jgi:Cdc6-like AAA superfamily ATPase
LKTHKLIFIEGNSGIGKSAVAKFLAHLLFDRNIFPDGVFYLNLKDCQNIESFFQQFYIKIKYALKEKDESWNPKQDEETLMSLDKEFIELTNLIQNFTFIAIFDDCDKIITEDHESLQESLVNILEKVQVCTQKLKILYKKC